MPRPLRVLGHVRRPLGSDLAGEDRTKSIDPESHTLVTNINAALIEAVFDITRLKLTFR
ncbi:MAG: hypothetical protein AAGL90_17440 [Pseudomonadota bacterium]